MLRFEYRIDENGLRWTDHHSFIGAIIIAITRFLSAPAQLDPNRSSSVRLNYGLGDHRMQQY